MYAQAKTLGINASQVVENGLEYQVDRGNAEDLRAEIERDIDALDAYEAKHGSFVDTAREHYESDSDGEEIQ